MRVAQGFNRLRRIVNWRTAEDRRLFEQEAIDVRSLVKLDEGLVHSAVYTSSALFEMEIEKIFHHGWVYVGHESEIPLDGDYVLRWIGRQSVILTRDGDGYVRLLMNRCRHRANSVCQLPRGNSSHFRCAYHGWTYKNSGELVGVPYSDGAYATDFNPADYPLVAVPQQATYRGFIWGNLANDGTTLDDHLGPAAKHAIDLFCDQSPVGKISLRHGTNKATIHANWKFQGGDGYHAPFTHQASFMAMRAKRAGKSNPLVAHKDDGAVARDLGNGHYYLDQRAVKKRSLPDAPWAEDYRASMITSYGTERAEYVINSMGFGTTVFMPNLQLLSPDVRVIRPIAVDRFEITFYCAFLEGVPRELNIARLRDTEERMSPAGSVNVDDVEMFERNQLGLQQVVNPWQLLTRGLSRERSDDDMRAPEAYRMASAAVGDYSDEVTQRAQLRWWADRLAQS